MSLKRSGEAAWLSRNADFATSIDADQTEISAVRFNSAPIQEGARDDRRSGSIADSLKAEGNPAERSFALSSKLEEVGGAIAEELRRRVLLLGSIYPFKIVGGTLYYEPRASSVYEFCLCASVAESLNAKPYNNLPVAFERLCCKISSSFFGPRARSVRTGWPRSLAKDRMPTRAKELFGKIHELTNEWRWAPDEDLPADPDPRFFKEQGLDLLTWIAMPDRRVGSFFLLGQCTCGKTDWFDKRHEPDLSTLRRWFKPMTTVDQPVKCLFVPFHIANISDIKDVSAKAFLLDRARIVLIAAGENKAWQSKFGAENGHLIRLVVSGGLVKARKI